MVIWRTASPRRTVVSLSSPFGPSPAGLGTSAFGTPSGYYGLC